MPFSRRTESHSNLCMKLPLSCLYVYAAQVGLSLNCLLACMSVFGHIPEYMASKVASTSHVRANKLSCRARVHWRFLEEVACLHDFGLMWCQVVFACLFSMLKRFVRCLMSTGFLNAVKDDAV